jgi:hypothetical protein
MIVWTLPTMTPIIRMTILKVTMTVIMTPCSIVADVVATVVSAEASLKTMCRSLLLQFLRLSTPIAVSISVKAVMETIHIFGVLFRQWDVEASVAGLLGYPR